MLIPIGFFGGAAAGTYELITTANGTGSSGIISFGSIPNTYKHLQIRWTAKSTAANTPTIRLTMNNDNGANYARHMIRGEGGGAPLEYSASSASYIDLPYGMNYSSNANTYAAGYLDILDYSATTKNKTVKSLFGTHDAANGYYINLLSGLWTSTTVVSTLTITAASDSFTTGSRFSLYGIKGV